MSGRIRFEGRKTWSDMIEEMQGVLDDYVVGCNERDSIRDSA